jgi:mRNA-degrading endonuclease toxin of MazEF toxin-antitoxin module
MQITKELIKIFANWTKLKIRIYAYENNLIFHEGEVWWTSLGQNIGVESNGKNAKFERPVVILKIFNEHSFLSLPLSSVEKTGKYYMKLKDIEGKSSIVNLSQIRILSSKRLIRNIEKLSSTDLKSIKEAVKSYL